METQTFDSQLSDIGSSNVISQGQLRVIKRDGRVTDYDQNHIRNAMKKAFIAVEGNSAEVSQRIEEIVTRLTDQITDSFNKRWPSGGTMHIEGIQDKVGLALMYAGLQKVAPP